MEHPHRALVVDDNDDIVQLLAMLLRQNGYETETASSAFEALDKCKTGSFDVIVSDIGMPGMNGFELAQRLRQGGCHSTVLIAITGFSLYGDRNRARAAGFNDLLIKPVGTEVLIATVERLLKNRK